MNWKHDCAVIIPCLNEQAAIGSVVADVRQFLPAVFVVDDGSSDETANAAKCAGATVLSHSQSRGKGAALKTGWQHAYESGFTFALFMDGDGQHAASDIPKFLECAGRTSADLVIGNRMQSPENMPRVRRFVNRWMSARISKLTGQTLPDSQCGFRLINLKALAAMDVEADHFEIESDVLLRFALTGRRIEFVPIEVIYKTEQSKIHPIPDALRWFRWLRQSRQWRNFPPQRCPTIPKPTVSPSASKSPGAV